jgi:hypothetical protein
LPEASPTGAQWPVSGVRAFVERAPWESGFAQVFDTAIVPQLGALEMLRQRRRMQVLACRVGGLVCGLIAVGLFPVGFMPNAPELMLEVLGAAVLACLLLAWYLPFRQVEAPRKSYRDSGAAIVLPPVLGFVGGIQHIGKAKPEQMTSLSELGRLDLLRYTANEWLIDDLLTGRDSGLGWEMAEILARQRERGKHAKVTIVFRGVVLRLDRPGGDGPPLLVLSPNMPDAPQPPPHTQRLLPEASPLAGRVVAWAEDGAALAHCIPAKAELPLAQWIESLGGRPFALAFAGKSLHVLLPSALDHFTAGGLDRPVAEIEHDMHELLAEVTLARRLAAALSV